MPVTDSDMTRHAMPLCTLLSYSINTISTWPLP